MKYTARHLRENVNVSRTHPLVEFAWLAGGLLALCSLVLLLLEWGSDYAARHLPQRYERWLGEHLPLTLSGTNSDPLQQRLNALLACLPEDSPLRNSRFDIQLDNSPQVNAVALPGGKIVVFQGLLEKISSENELALVLAHELGHFAHRDHLRRLGHGLGVTAFTLLIFGQDSTVSDMVGRLFLDAGSHYSRRQEAAADRFALQLLVTRYGHAGGATDFFRRFDAEAGSRIPYLVASHPHPADRIDELDTLIRQGAYPLGPLEPLGEDLLELLAEQPEPCQTALQPPAAP